jgi:hypothetical protein
MKKISPYAWITLLILLAGGCNKNNPGVTNGPPPGSKTWLVKVIFTPTQCGNGTNNFEHKVFTYNDKGQITRYIDSACAASSSFSITCEYDAQGKLTQINSFQGIYQILTTKIIYNGTGEFVAQSIPSDTVHYFVGNLTWNANNDKELDEIIYTGQWVSGSPYGPYARYFDFFYDAGGGLHSESSHYIGQAIQDIFSVSIASSGATIPNPLHKGRTPEQNFIYFFVLQAVDYVNVLGDGLNTSTYEAYSYSTGSKVAGTHYNYSYTLDSNQNVSKISQSYALAGSTSYQPGIVWNISYEQH